jgi:hypothetical protein
MYGTVMVARCKAGRDDLVRSLEKWQQSRDVPGFDHTDVLFGDDGTTVVSAVHFRSREEYLALADDPAQDEWWRTTMMPLLDGDPTWIDGEWASST